MKTKKHTKRNNRHNSNYRRSSVPAPFINLDDIMDFNPFELMSEEQKQRFEKETGIKVRDKQTRTCCVCGKSYFGYGNNANPVVAGGVCCDKCDSERVIPARLGLLIAGFALKV